VPTELVLLSEVELTSLTIIRAGAVDHPNGTLIEYRGGEIRQLIDDQGRALLSVYRTRPVAVAREAAAAIVDPPKAFGLWTDLAIPFGDLTAGRAVAQAIADAVGGVIKDRT
jgi:hypothetical protein